MTKQDWAERVQDFPYNGKANWHKKKQIFLLRLEGKKLATIAARFNLSIERVRQILKDVSRILTDHYGEQINERVPK